MTFLNLLCDWIVQCRCLKAQGTNGSRSPPLHALISRPRNQHSDMMGRGRADRSVLRRGGRQGRGTEAEGRDYGHKSAGDDDRCAVRKLTTSHRTDLRVLQHPTRMHLIHIFSDGPHFGLRKI